MYQILTVQKVSSLLKQRNWNTTIYSCWLQFIVLETSKLSKTTVENKLVNQSGENQIIKK